jgi:hypothetical protein
MKYNRILDEIQLNNSKEKNIEAVMDRVLAKRSFKFNLKSFKLIGASFVIILVFGLSYVLFSNQSTPEIELTEYSSDRIVETSYLTGNIIAYSVKQVNTVNLVKLSFMQLADTETEFEQGIDEFNQYFDMLKVFIDDEDFNKNNTIQYLTDSDYQILIQYIVDDNQYDFYLTIDGEELDGILHIDNLEFQVAGELIETENEYFLELLATNGENYISIEYSSETKDESEKEYKIKQLVDGIETEREVKVKEIDGKVTVEINEGNNEYKLDKITNGEDSVYFLEYEINELEGEVYITETIDQFDKTIYSYHIEEDGFEKEIELEDPDDDEEDEEDEEEPDEEDEEESEEEDESEEDESTELEEIEPEEDEEIDSEESQEAAAFVELQTNIL